MNILGKVKTEITTVQQFPTEAQGALWLIRGYLPVLLASNCSFAQENFPSHLSLVQLDSL